MCLLGILSPSSCLPRTVPQWHSSSHLQFWINGWRRLPSSIGYQRVFFALRSLQDMCWTCTCSLYKWLSVLPAFQPTHPFLNFVSAKYIVQQLWMAAYCKEKSMEQGSFFPSLAILVTEEIVPDLSQWMNEDNVPCSSPFYVNNYQTSMWCFEIFGKKYSIPEGRSLVHPRRPFHVLLPCFVKLLCQSW